LIKPKWFDLSNYDALANLDKPNWAVQLACRYYFFFEATKKPRPLEKKPTTKEIRTQLDELFKNPVIPHPEGKNSQLNMDEHQPANYAGLFQANIRPLTCFRLSELYNYLPERYIRTFNEAGWKSKRDELFIRYGNKLVSETCLRRYTNLMGDGHDYGLLATRYLDLNLLATDEQLINDFKQYLKEEREISAFVEGGNMKPGILAKLFSDRVLPYLDLILWAKYNDIEISYYALGSWLFPDSDVDPAEKIRRGTKKLADRVLTNNFISTLYGTSGM